MRPGGPIPNAPILVRKLLFITCVSLTCALQRVSATDFFETRIRPVLYDQCVQCHGPEKQKGGLRLDSREALLTGGESGPAVVVGKPGESLLLKAVGQEDKDLQMPPLKAGPKLEAAVIADMATWVREGLDWPQGGGAVAIAKDAFNLESRKQRLPWIWQTPQRQTVPDEDAENDVDRFVIAKLAEKGLKPSPAAEDRTWLRRVYFAITGFPPRREEMQAFLRDQSAGRRERLVDALLASPHFGERWARHWLDLVRYAETRGHESDFLIANAWQYRDYVIRAFNADVPYDRFVAEHIAGDLRPARIDPESGANESVLATGWAFLGEEVHSPVDIRQDECERVDNKVDVLSKTFLGLTVACARCHDHKFDAITQKDYYALSGFVLSSPFRQVRFQTMEAHARANVQLAELRKQHSPRIAAAYAEAAGSRLEHLTSRWMEVRRALLREVAPASNQDPGEIASLAREMKRAQADDGHPLHFFSRILHDPQSADPAGLQRLIDEFPAPMVLPAEVRVIADYTKADATPWKSDGPGFGTHALKVGEIVLGIREQAIARVMSHGAAVRDAFWKSLSLSPGTEMDSGAIAAESRAGKTLLTPTVVLGEGRLQLLLRGKAQIYAAVNSHIMVTGPLHGRLMSSHDTGDSLRWITLDLSAYAGHRVHLEISPAEDSNLEVVMIVEAPNPPTWRPMVPWKPGRAVENLSELTKALQADLQAAMEALATGKLADQPLAASLADWVIQNSSLLNVDASLPRKAAADYFQAQEDLAKTIRWDSPTAVSWADGTGVDEKVLIRGKYAKPGAVAPRGLPEALGQPPITTTASSGRAELARQMTDHANPLVARVMVNRIWHHLFGRGIVATVDNFGFLGERPSHPELLDHLAWQFVHEDGWSIKRMIRRLVLSRTYAQSSHEGDGRATELDPSNILLHRMPVQRLEGEAIRDAVLIVSGRFNPKACGPPVPVHLTDFIIGRGRPDSGPLDGDGRRSIYTSVRRNFLPTMMLAFDFPTPFSTNGRRNITNVPAQSLVMMNDPFIREQATVWAERLLGETPGASAEQRMDWLFETSLTRLPTAEEKQLMLDSLGEIQAVHPGEPEKIGWQEICHALLNSNDFIYLK